LIRAETIQDHVQLLQQRAPGTVTPHPVPANLLLKIVEGGFRYIDNCQNVAGPRRPRDPATTTRSKTLLTRVGKIIL